MSDMIESMDTEMMETEASEMPMLELITDWLENIEELILSEADHQLVNEIAMSLEELRTGALDMNVLAEDFEDWLRLDVLENWSSLLEDYEEEIDPVQSFYNFFKGGEQRLYFQMMKHCLTIADARSA